MTYLTLEDLKKHLNIDATFTGDDDYISSLGEVAEQMVEQHLEKPLAELANGGSLPAPIIHAMKLLVGTLYMARETVAFGQAYQIPMSYVTAYDYLIDPYKNYKESAR